MKGRQKAAFGDFQTPLALARSVVHRIAAEGISPTHVIEPTVGVGNFLVAAAESFPGTELFGLDVSAEKIASAREVLGDRARLEHADFFAYDWDRLARSLKGQIAIVGNPPWVTNSDLTVLEMSNLPKKSNLKGLNGFDSLTGRSNFDISEWMLIRLVQAFSGADVSGSVLLKTTVARRLLEFAARRSLPMYGASIVRIDAGLHFDAAVDACLFQWRSDPRDGRDGRVFADLSAPEPTVRIGVRDGVLVADLEAYESARDALGKSAIEWRSGVKHDCAPVMELRRVEPGRYENSAGEVCEIEDELVFPLAKSSDLAHDRGPSRWVLLPQRVLGEDTRTLATRAPHAWSYLQRHAETLGARRSSIYRGQPPFSVFGIGDYTFLPWKVAISGLYKNARFSLLGPADERPVVLDDTGYFLAFADEQSARLAHFLLSSEPAQNVIRATVFWDAKRPITKAVLSRIDLGRLARAARSVPADLRAAVGRMGGGSQVSLF